MKPRFFTDDERDEVVHHALIAWLWTESDEHGEPLLDTYSVEDITESEQQRWEHEVTQFLVYVRGIIGAAPLAQIGHSFTMSRQLTGCGFDDMGRYQYGEQLENLATLYDYQDAYVRKDGKIESL